MNKSSRISVWLFLVTFSLVFYGLGASLVESFVNYPTWTVIGPAEFRGYHQALSSLIVPVMVVPLVVTTILTALLLWFRPAAIPRWAIWLALGLQIIIWISTVTIQLPIQFALSSDGLSIPAIQRLITTNLWLRTFPGVINAGLFFWMMSLLLRNHYIRMNKEQQITYEITATVRPDLCSEYERYMIDRHIPDLLETGAFEGASFSRSSDDRYRIRYEARSREALDQYLTEHASRLRLHLTESFKDGIELSREEWEQIEKWGI